jgi:general secretion pathway protein G
MVELVFVIVVLGILAGIAIPKLAATRDDAEFTKARSVIAGIRSSIVNERQSRLFRGDPTFINTLDANGAGAAAAGSIIFDNNGTAANSLLTYGVVTKTGNAGWMKTGDNQYTYTLLGVSVPFTYTQATGIFTCNRNAAGNVGEFCRDLID